MAETHADVREYLVVHESLRRTLDRFVGAAARLEPDELAVVIGSRWALFARSLHHHHEVEDTAFFPVILRERPDVEALVTRLETEHKELVVRLDAVDAAVATLEAQPTVANRQAVHDTIAEVRDFLVPHLDIEDAELLPVAAESVDGREWKRLSDDALRSLPKADLPIAAGALDEVAHSLPPSERPPPPPLLVRMLMAISWRKRYAKFVEPFT